jgi:hypothetical protein
MLRASKLAGWVLSVSAACAWAADQHAPKEPSPPRPPAVRPNAPKGAPPRAGQNAMGPPITNPGNPVSRLYRASPEARDRALEKLPPRQQEQIRKNLEWFDKLPKADQAEILRRTERFEALSPEKRKAFMQQWQALGKLAPDRRGAIGAALRQLQRMSEPQRTNVINSEEFRSRFSPEEQRIIADLSEVMLAPI